MTESEKAQFRLLPSEARVQRVYSEMEKVASIRTFLTIAKMQFDSEQIEAIKSFPVAGTFEIISQEVPPASSVLMLPPKVFLAQLWRFFDHIVNSPSGAFVDWQGIEATWISPLAVVAMIAFQEDAGGDGNVNIGLNPLSEQCVNAVFVAVNDAVNQSRISATGATLVLGGAEPTGSGLEAYDSLVTAGMSVSYGS